MIFGRMEYVLNNEAIQFIWSGLRETANPPTLDWPGASRNVLWEKVGHLKQM